MTKQIGSECEDIGGARKHAESEREQIASTIDGLLDKITETNRPYVDRRLKSLTFQREKLAAVSKNLKD